MAILNVFDHIKIHAMSDAEKLDLMERGDEYLKILSSDDKFAIRFRAKKKLNESEAEQQKRFLEDIQDLLEAEKSEKFTERVRAKIILDRLRESGKIDV